MMAEPNGNSSIPSGGTETPSEHEIQPATYVMTLPTSRCAHIQSISTSISIAPIQRVARLPPTHRTPHTGANRMGPNDLLKLTSLPLRSLSAVAFNSAPISCTDLTSALVTLARARLLPPSIATRKLTSTVLCGMNLRAHNRSIDPSIHRSTASAMCGYHDSTA